MSTYQAVWSLAFDPQSRHLLVGLQDGRVRQLNLLTRQWTDVGRHEAAVCGVDWSRSGELLSASLDGSARVWRVLDGTPTLKHALRHGSPVLAAAFDAEGQRVVTGTEDARTRLWDLSSASPTDVELVKHEKAVRAVAFSPQADWVLSGGGNVSALSCRGAPAPGTVLPCEAADKVERIPPYEGPPQAQTVRSVAISPMGGQFAVIDASGELNVYRTDYRAALWQQQDQCLPMPARRRLLRETAKQAAIGHQLCQTLVAACARNTVECTAALARASLK